MKKVLIIGATSGIGRELAAMYAADGCRVAITGRRAQLLEEQRAANPALVARPLDITDTDSLGAKLYAVAAELGGVDLLVLSSGTGDINEALDFGVEKRTIDTNVAGFTAVCDWAMSYFEAQGGGHLAAITSVAGLRGSRACPAYNASKVYQMNYLEAMRQKARALRKPIFVTDIRPGFVDTAMAKGEGLFWVAPVAKAARHIYKAVEGTRKVAYVTRRWRLVAWVLGALPRVVYDRM